MSFDQSRRMSSDRAVNGQAVPQNGSGRSKPGQSGDVREAVGRVAPSKKIETNRNNAKKSTGPRTSRGKSHSRWNALKHGAFATQRLIQGEDEKAYRLLSARIYSEATPKTAVEIMLADQIVGDIWRLRRVEQAERAYFEQVRASALARVLRTLSAEEFRLVPRIVEGAKSPITESAEAMMRTVTKKLQTATDPDRLMLDGIVSANRTFPYPALEQVRRSLVRDVLRKDDSLSALQRNRLTIGHAPTDEI